MSLDLRDIERSVGADLMRRPLLTASVNAALLRVYLENVLSNNDEDEDELEIPPEIFLERPLNAPAPRPSITVSRLSETSTDTDVPPYRPATFLQNLLAALLYITTSLLRVVGLFETVVWIVFAVVFKVLHLPRVYGFEKLLLDLRALVFPHGLRHIERTVRYHVERDGPPIAPILAERRGIGPLSITVVTPANDLARDTSATLRLFRYATQFPSAFWDKDVVVLVGKHAEFVDTVLGTGAARRGEALRVELGWHVDVVEETRFKLAVEFTREPPQLRDALGSPTSSPVRWASKRVVHVELAMEASTEALELLVKSMDQFASICEASERGRRPFNGKRVSIYAIGLFISVALIVFYEGAQGLIKPSADVLTLAVGAFTLWMTLGRSAALGDIEEETTFKVQARDNILLSYHGLAHIMENVLHTCWVPETMRAEPTDKVIEDGELQDGSISLLEAAVCLSIFNHFGHLVKWKGPKLNLNRLRLQMSDDSKAQDVGHVVAVDRVPSLQVLPFVETTKNLKFLGGPRCSCCKEIATKLREEREANAQAIEEAIEEGKVAAGEKGTAEKRVD